MVDDVLGKVALECPRLGVVLHAHDSAQVERVEDFAVYVELELRRRSVADPDRRRTLITR